jgi:carbonyl reductase 1
VGPAVVSLGGFWSSSLAAGEPSGGVNAVNEQGGSVSSENGRPVAVVTGANRGLGFETARQLAERGVHVVVGSRDAAQSEAAASALRAEGLSAEPGIVDVSDADSVTAFAEGLAASVGAFQILVNNAGVSLRGFNEDVVRRTLDVNVAGVFRVTDTLLPLLDAPARVVMVSSGMGELDCLGPPRRRQFADPSLTRSDLETLLAEFRNEVADGRHQESGWPSSAYSVSKAALNAYTRILAGQLGGHRVLVNAVCPGWVRTAMGGSRAPRSVAEGARGIVWAALLPEDGPTGGFFRDGKRIPW